MSKDDVIEVEGVVVEALRNAEFRVRLTNNHYFAVTLDNLALVAHGFY